MNYNKHMAGGKKTRTEYDIVAKLASGAWSSKGGSYGSVDEARKEARYFSKLLRDVFCEEVVEVQILKRSVTTVFSDREVVEVIPR